MKKRHQQKLVILSFALLMAFNLPLLLVFDSATLVLGIPVIYIYIFSIILISIFLTWITIKRYYE